jgi:hypothetical protein
VASPLAGRPYDLRHAAVSLCSMRECPRPKSPSGPGTASRSCCVSTPSASMTVRPSRTSASTQRSWSPDVRLRSRESHPKDRPTCADTRSDQAAAIPRISHDQRLTAASDGIWLHACKQNQGRCSAPELVFCWWQVLGSNQRRLSRRFYREPPQRVAGRSDLAKRDRSAWQAGGPATLQPHRARGSGSDRVSRVALRGCARPRVGPIERDAIPDGWRRS